MRELVKSDEVRGAEELLRDPPGQVQRQLYYTAYCLLFSDNDDNTGL